MEVADTSAYLDPTVKVRLYVRTGVPEYWFLILRTTGCTSTGILRTANIA